MGSRTTTPWWLWTAVAWALAAAFGLAFLLVPEVDVLVRTAGNVLGSGEPSAVRIFLVTRGGRSPLAAVALLVWQSLAAPVPEAACLRASGLMWGPVAGTLINWVGLFLGGAAAFVLSRVLIGIPLARVRPPARPRLGIAAAVLLGVRLLPVVPGDFVSLAAGGLRVRFREFALATAAATLPPALVYAVWPGDVAGLPVVIMTWTAAAAGSVLLAYLAWRHRAAIPFGTLSAERKRNLIATAVMVAAALAVYWFVPSVRSGIDDAAVRIASGDISAFRDYLRGFGVWAPVVSAALMVLQSVLAPLPAFVITFSNGLLFGWAWGALLSWSSAMAGAALCFYLARALGRPAVEKLVGGSAALRISDRFFERFGDRAVLVARLLPFVSFDIISYGAGLTPMRFWPFFIATGIGQLPATLVYSYLGQNLSGSVRIVFFTFVITIAIFVAIASVRPLFMRWLDRDKRSAEQDVEAGE